VESSNNVAVRSCAIAFLCALHLKSTGGAAGYFGCGEVRMSELLGIYLGDHLGGAQVAVQLLEAMCSQHEEVSGVCKEALA